MTRLKWIFANLALLVLGSGPAFAQDAVAGAQFYELTENAKFTFGRSQMPFREAAVSQMLGFAAVGTPLCPTAAFTTPVPGVPPLPANPAAVCVLNVTASDQIDLRTGAGTINGKFTVVTADLFPAVDAPETIVIRGNFSGQIDFSPVLQSPPLPYGTVTGHFTSNAEGGHTPFFGVFLLPFADPQNQSGFGYLLYNLMPNSNCPQNVCIMSSPSQPIQLNQLSIGYPTARFDIYFSQ